MEAEGIELSGNPHDSRGKPNVSTSGAAKASVALSPPVVADADLAAVMEAWPTLSPAMRAGILAMGAGGEAAWVFKQRRIPPAEASEEIPELMRFKRATSALHLYPHAPR